MIWLSVLVSVPSLLLITIVVFVGVPCQQEGSFACKLLSAVKELVQVLAIGRSTPFINLVLNLLVVLLLLWRLLLGLMWLWVTGQLK